MTTRYYIYFIHYIWFDTIHCAFSIENDKKKRESFHFHYHIPSTRFQRQVHVYDRPSPARFSFSSRANEPPKNSERKRYETVLAKRSRSATTSRISLSHSTEMNAEKITNRIIFETKHGRTTGDRISMLIVCQSREFPSSSFPIWSDRKRLKATRKWLRSRIFLYDVCIVHTHTQDFYFRFTTGKTMDRIKK